ncbi:hypothetical protein OS493_001082 [Desmophyllum pertusum]|uniref:Uncharacterized protein n=1 Tax=Desmophyllum pertusum TaxID=174260 RepID=A0A9W9ZV37_9CNID|nr:hypothetical protein OS493_001082 [Desmophyllum pertusum]
MKFKLGPLIVLRPWKNWEPISTDPVTANKQLEQLQAVKDDLEKHQASLKDSKSLAEELLSSSDDPVSAAELQSRTIQS